MKPRIKVVKPAASLGDFQGASYEEITLAEQAHRMLRRDIISGAIPAGQPLRLEYLKERYGISFSPLREALNRLHSERLVISTTSRGFRVAPFSEEEMWDVIETRIVIDCEALRRSLARGDDEWEARLVASFHALMLATGRRAADAGAPECPDEVQLEDRHHDFHRCLMAACGSRWLLGLSDQLYAQTERYRQPSLRDRSYWNLERDVGTEHRQLLDAAVARDAGRAAGLLAQHYRETGRMVRKMLTMTESEGTPA
ncbi:GntR family transcriptional regulator [Verminephrobacter eiseniae]|uniref:Transcriptional regulator, GntR family n=1 Tax=Verminephrobacter eiseniae (strain EF01-2) TaxID=391735 RepID=A1WQK1_VEREI|nr:FCD domain-containing protein [Verminephrobacter eiseniae]ABM59908.1 transcriptional regulator, GntR family [Verminephrobacter eiseniae EF01-2]MCW5285416.1 FCD domain-containing protein [Verminephrobacter eiseniae]MCW5303716.1 FCD domain-containing protein [Verminephrobacter eiseniae]MCW8182794.1 FCD domain-containing protein [Verminephrobacter eiseniae]MCW8191512.1 FCD domain-containing protein [Verminephrobacter eiseniae]